MVLQDSHLRQVIAISITYCHNGSRQLRFFRISAMLYQRPKMNTLVFYPKSRLNVVSRPPICLKKKEI